MERESFILPSNDAGDRSALHHSLLTVQNLLI